MDANRYVATCYHQIARWSETAATVLSLAQHLPAELPPPSEIHPADPQGICFVWRVDSKKGASILRTAIESCWSPLEWEEVAKAKKIDVRRAFISFKGYSLLFIVHYLDDQGA
ncbi:MAG: hypothetical protein AMXMBFR16_10910 [Candidatus Uhrbacteria bacterium]